MAIELGDRPATSADAPLVSIRHLKTYYPIRGSFGSGCSAGKPAT